MTARRHPRRAPIVAAAASTLAVAACALAVAASALSAVALAFVSPAGRVAAGASARAGWARHTATANRQAAEHDATTLLARLALPAGSLTLAAEPTGDGGALSRPASGPSVAHAVTDQHRWWRVLSQPATVVAFIMAHGPGGAKLITSGSSRKLRGEPAGHFLGYQWPAVAGVLWDRQLVVAIAGLPGGVTGVRADAQVQWMIPRPAGERIPAGVHELNVTRARPHRAPTVSLHITDPVKIRTIMTMVNRLDTVQPGVWACTAFPTDAPIVTFTFRASLHGSALASASEPALATQPTTPCDRMTFRIRGHAHKPLLGGAAVVRAAGRLLGVKLHATLPL